MRNRNYSVLLVVSFFGPQFSCPVLLWPDTIRWQCVTPLVTRLLPLCYGCDFNSDSHLPICYGCYGSKRGEGGKYSIRLRPPTLPVLTIQRLNVLTSVRGSEISCPLFPWPGTIPWQ